MRLIDADELKKELSKRLWFVSSPEHDAQEIMDIIDDAPTIPLPEKEKENELLKAYAKGFDTGVKTEREQSIKHSCEACKYRFYAFDGYPCANCRRNLFLVNEIREQKNDLWKDGTPK